MANATKPKLYLRDFFIEPTGRGGWQLKWDVYQTIAILVGVIMLLIYASRTQGWYTFAVCTWIAAVALAFGLLLGFLFGIPKAAQEESARQQPAPQQVAQPQAGQPQSGQAQIGAPQSAQQQVGQAPAAQQPAPSSPPSQPKTSPTKHSLKANTNLVEISDWLTKMIVGVGLYQLSTLPGKLKSLAGYFATAFGAPTPPLVMAILGYFGIFGFLLGYLWARIYLTKEFEQDCSDEAAPQASSTT